MTDREVDPHLADKLATQLSQDKARQNTQPATPQIVVNGNNNVFAWGGTVHVGESGPAPVRE
jgi:hypothetical protein